MSRSAKIEKLVFINASGQRKDSWEYERLEDELKYFPDNRLTDSFLKGIHDFVEDLSAGNSYQLSVENNQIFGRLIQKQKSPYCYLVVIFDVKFLKKLRIKKLEKKVGKLVKFCTKRLERGHLSLFRSSDPINLKDFVHELIQV